MHHLVKSQQKTQVKTLRVKKAIRHRATTTRMETGLRPVPTTEMKEKKVSSNRCMEMSRIMETKAKQKDKTTEMRGRMESQITVMRDSRIMEMRVTSTEKVQRSVPLVSVTLALIRFKFS